MIRLTMTENELVKWLRANPSAAARANTLIALAEGR